MTLIMDDIQYYVLRGDYLLTDIWFAVKRIVDYEN